MAYDYKQDFPLLRDDGCRLCRQRRHGAASDSASLTRKTTSTARHNANPLRGLYPLSVEATRRL